MKSSTYLYIFRTTYCKFYFCSLINFSFQNFRYDFPPLKKTPPLPSSTLKLGLQTASEAISKHFKRIAKSKTNQLPNDIHSHVHINFKLYKRSNLTSIPSNLEQLSNPYTTFRVRDLNDPGFQSPICPYQSRTVHNPAFIKE